MPSSATALYGLSACVGVCVGNERADAVGELTASIYCCVCECVCV